jgi:dCTP deaminase
MAAFCVIMATEFNQTNYPEQKAARERVEISVPGGLLSKDQIMAHIEAGNIIIDPFEPRCVGGASVDVRLGEYFYREKGGTGTVNLWDSEAAEELWVGPYQAQTVGELRAVVHNQDNLTEALRELEDTERVILLRPGENILGHTWEFIGGKENINTAMQARSSMGRSHVTVCRCAGWGDPGYCNRWTMEITNNSLNHSVLLVAKRRVAQIVFWQVEPVQRGYGANGKYQIDGGIEAIKEKWEPKAMLPKLYLDWDIERRALGERRVRQSRRPDTDYAIPPIEWSTDIWERRRDLSFSEQRTYAFMKEVGMTELEILQALVKLEKDGIVV